MKKFVGLVMLCGVFLSAPAFAAKSAQPEDINFEKATCRGFLKVTETASAADVGGLVMWMSGYLGGASGDPVLSWSNMNSFAKELVIHCKSHGSDALLDAARKVNLKR